jgi:hypothetical protein
MPEGPPSGTDRSCQRFIIDPSGGNHAGKVSDEYFHRTGLKSFTNVSTSMRWSLQIAAR